MNDNDEMPAMPAPFFTTPGGVVPDLRPPVRVPRAEPAQDPAAEAEARAIKMGDAEAAMKVNREARMAAQARGAPAHAVEILLGSTMAVPPMVPGYGKPCRMTPAMRQIMMRWARLPDDCRQPDLTCLMLCFLKPREAWGMLQGYDAGTLRWTNEPLRKAWQEAVMELSLTLTEQPAGLTEDLAAWINERVADFFGPPAAAPMPTAGTKPPPVAAVPRGAAPAGGSGPCIAWPKEWGVTSSVPSGTVTW